MMRTTRILGGESTQGLAFGALDGGRGLVAAVVGSIALWILSIFIGSEVLDVDPSERAAAFKKVILFFSLLIFAISILVAYALRPLARTSSIDFERLSAEGLRKVLRLPTVWLQALIIICAYSGYRVADDFSLLAQDVLGYNEVDAAGVGTISLWLRPIAAIGAGLLADRVSTSRMTQCCFILLIIAGLVMGFWPITANVSLVVLFVIVTTCVGVYALRGLYFAIMKEGRIPIAVTGTAVGMASIVGYLPDIYMAPLTGWLVDEYPGALGHQYVFMLLAAFSVLGLVATIIFRSVAKA
jgi:nitrate/nitrite transporter NarK